MWPRSDAGAVDWVRISSGLSVEVDPVRCDAARADEVYGRASEFEPV